MGRENTFKQTMDSFFNSTNQEFNRDKTDLSYLAKRRLLYHSKLFIVMKKVEDRLKNYLNDGEEILAYLPFTNEGNTALTTGGLMGMMYVNSQEGKDYVKNFNNLRGNRTLIFTNQRMLFMVVLEFIEEDLFYSYPYETLKSIKFKPNVHHYFDWGDRKKGTKTKRVKVCTYTLDFQSENHIFTELLSESDARRFYSALEKVPQLKPKLSTKVQRNTRFDYYFSNANFGLKVGYVISALFIIGAIILIIGYFAGFGVLYKMRLGIP